MIGEAKQKMIVKLKPGTIREKLDRAKKPPALAANRIAPAARAEERLILADADAKTSLIDAESRGTLVKALPWVLGAVVVMGALYLIRKKG